tara:strand:+ start:142 stop:558 length:417 start_codon:yes stop_codon:yes gene_type:complete
MSYKIIAKYIKEIKFEIPNPKSFFLLTKNISNYKINIDIKSNQLKDKMIEIETSLSLNPTKNDFDKIITKITLSSIIEFEGKILDKENLKKIILIEVPSGIYSEIREIFLFLFNKSGFKEIKIDKEVDFQKLYEQRKN